MNKDLQNGLSCSQFEALLAEALDDDGQGLPAKTREAFEAHRKSCPDCASLFAEAQEGMLSLRTLQEVEPPRNLVHNILAATSRAETVAATTLPDGVKTGWWQSLTHPRRLPRLGFLHSRFVTSFCMAFFSLSLTLSLAGVRLNDLSRIDWHPSALRRSVVLQYTQIEAKVVRYYDNMRAVYVVESLGQQLKRAVAPAQNDNNRNNKDNTRPDQQNRKVAPGTGRPSEEENYSRGQDSGALQEARSMPVDAEPADPTMSDQGAQL